MPGLACPPRPVAFRSATANQGNQMATTEAGIRELLEAGVHFGHQTRRWHPKMRRYIFGERDGIYIIDLLQTVDLLEQARAFAEDLASKGGVMLCVGAESGAQGTSQGACVES